MNALSIDGATSRLIISAKKDDYSFTNIYDIGQKQSQSIVVGIDYVFSQLELKPQDLDYVACSIGPGSFTGLRLVLSCVKAIELSCNVPVYGISSLKMYEHCFKDFDLPILSAIDANKNRFYASITNKNKVLLEEGDWQVEKIINQTKKIKKIIIAGPDSQKLSSIIQQSNKKIKIYKPNTSILTTQSLFSIAEKNIADKIPPIKDFDGPIYLRASEAEIKKNQ